MSIPGKLFGIFSISWRWQYFTNIRHKNSHKEDKMRLNDVKTCGKGTQHLAALLILLIIGPAAQAWGDITPTDVYYLAKSADDSLISMYELSSELTKKRISNNLRPRNVYQKVLSVADEFNFLHPNALDSLKLSEANNLDMSRTGPSDVHKILGLIKDYLKAKGSFIENFETRNPKTPNDVFQMLRQISMHHHEIVRKKGLITDWAKPERVYEAVVANVLPVTQDLAAKEKVAYKSFAFPKQAVSGVIPRYVYKLLYHMYQNLSDYYMNKGGYDPIILEQVNDCDKISPEDVFDLTLILAAELKAKGGKKTLGRETAAQYKSWKEGKEKIVPGDVFRLIQHNFILSKKILEHED
jgi:hypothetical protein